MTEKWIKQAELSGEKIAEKKIKFDNIYSSPLKRAFKTVEIISWKVSGPKPIVLDYLIERNFGIMSGRHHFEIVKMCSPKIFQTKDIAYFLEPEWGENFPQTIERARRVIERIKKENGDGNVLIVTHGDIWKMLYTAFMIWFGKKLWINFILVMLIYCCFLKILLSMMFMFLRQQRSRMMSRWYKVSYFVIIFVMCYYYLEIIK